MAAASYAFRGGRGAFVGWHGAGLASGLGASDRLTKCGFKLCSRMIVEPPLYLGSVAGTEPLYVLPAIGDYVLSEVVAGGLFPPSALGALGPAVGLGVAVADCANPRASVASSSAALRCRSGDRAAPSPRR